MIEKILKQVCKYEQGLTLRKLGILQEHSTYYLYHTGKDVIVTHTFIQPYESQGDSPWVAVFTVAELGDLLPVGTLVRKTANGWQAELNTDAALIRSGFHDVEAHSRAELLILLLENKAFTIKQFNSKLAKRKKERSS